METIQRLLWAGQIGPETRAFRPLHVLAIYDAQPLKWSPKEREVRFWEMMPSRLLLIGDDSCSGYKCEAEPVFVITVNNALVAAFQRRLVPQFA